ncbi:MAG: glycoside hydrolase family 20 zincin-like fold domain-containing protein, partial [Bacteroidota bacterium]|nr:glycoside hydrolase family 20 zincin-like fold domain-containing protein [Bacteroidota bacterium]
MKKYIFLLTGILFAILVSCNNSGNVNSISIIPQPSHITVNSGHFTFNRYTSVYVSDNSAQLASYAQYLSNLFAVPAGFNLRIREGSYEGRGNSIVLDMTGSPDELGNEGYKLAVSERRI